MCRSGGAIADVNGAIRDTPDLAVADLAGYQIDQADRFYRGRDPDRVTAAAATSGRLSGDSSRVG